MKTFLRDMPREKIKINWNKNPIKMDDFLAFLTVEVREGKGHLGWSNGWTRHYGDNGLVVRGGTVNRVEYLDSLEYKEKLDSSYHNYVNPFYLFEILNDEGKRFFINYYSDEINKELESAKVKLHQAKKRHEDIYEFWGSMGV